MKSQLIINSILPIAMFLFFGCHAQSKKVVEGQVNSIDSLLSASYQNGELNGNVLVIKNGGIFYERSFGYANGSKTKQLSKDYRFNIGSVYKEFPAVAIMQLYEKKKLDLHDKLSQYLPELPKWADKVSILNLLQYSGGLPKVNWKFGENMDEEDMKNDLLHLEELKFTPGSDYLYTNNSPFLLIKIVERITEKEFKIYAQEYLFEPNGLHHTVIKEQFPYKDKMLMAISFNSEFKEDDFEINVSTVLFNSTAYDMYTWFDRLNTFKIIDETSLNILAQTANLNKTANVNNSSMQAPLGSPIVIDGKIIEHSHHGAAANYECVVRRYNTDDITIVIMTNQKNNNVYDLSDDIRMALMDEKSLGVRVRKAIMKDVEKGIAYYRQSEQTSSGDSGQNGAFYMFKDESYLKRIGYRLLDKGEVEDAVKVFELLVSEFPDSSNAYNGLGEVYYANEQYDLALSSYKKSLELFPGNDNAKNKILKMENR